jgi:hypothetical protein
LLLNIQAGELSENSLISEIFITTSEKIRQVFLPNAYAFRDFCHLPIEFSEIFFDSVFSTLSIICPVTNTCFTGVSIILTTMFTSVFWACNNSPPPKKKKKKMSDDDVISRSVGLILHFGGVGCSIDFVFVLEKLKKSV